MSMNIFRTINRTHLSNEYKEAVQFARTIPNETWEKMSKLLFCEFKSPNDMRICRIEEGVFAQDIFYHGEKVNKPPKSYKLDENSIICEEMGDGLYITPSKKVAAFWAGINGKIFKLKLNTDKIAQVNQNQIETMIRVIANNVKGFDSNPTGQRLNVIIRILFQKNGYDAAYAKKSMSNGFKDAGKFFDSLIGESQQQLAIYTNSVVEVLPKNFIEKISNQIQQIKSCIQYYKSLQKYYESK